MIKFPSKGEQKEAVFLAHRRPGLAIIHIAAGVDPRKRLTAAGHYYGRIWQDIAYRHGL